MHWDLLIRGATVFDGTGTPGRRVDVAVKDGRIAAHGAGLPAEAAAQVHDADGGWLIPGLLDIHTHEDLEVELEPGLPEVVRHGTTSVVAGNCSIGLAFGNQRRDGQDPIVDCFARVENIPKPVLRKAADLATWRTSAEYLAHLDDLPLGANLAPLLPDSMLRIEVMGLDASIRRDPDADELARMEALLDRAMTEGYVGFSTDGLPLHFLANQPHKDKRIPTQYASFAEYRRLTDVVRRHGRVWQMTPATDDGALTLKLFLLSSGRLYGRPLKITALAALDSVSNRTTRSMAKRFARLFNSRLLDGRFRMQALAAPFKIWSEGAISPLAEGNPLMRRLIETEVEDREARARILDEPAFVDAFRAMWNRGKSGFSLARLLRLLRLENEFLTRDLNDMVIYRSPVPDWAGLTMAELFGRYLDWRTHGGDDNAEQARAFAAIGAGVRDDGEFFLALLRHFDRDLYWHYVSANRDPAVVRELLLHPQMLPGFNDSGAHVTNMAYYDGNLRALRIGAAESEALFSRMVQRLTREPAEFFGLDAGRMDIGCPADLVVLDPDKLKTYDGDANIRLVYRDAFECQQLVNRSDGVVRATYVAGRRLWNGLDFEPGFGQARAGRALVAS
ncbi:MAG: amidohydrolase family protein [Pseudomonadales bacterium]